MVMVSPPSIAGRRTLMGIKSRLQLAAPALHRNAFVRKIRNAVEAREHRVELGAIDVLAFVGAVAIRLVEPAVRQRVVVPPDAEAMVDQPLDAHDVQPDPIEL